VVQSFLQTKTLKDHLELSFSVNASISNKQTASTGLLGQSVLNAMYYYNPLVPVKNADGTWYSNTSISQNYNPLSMVYEDQYKTKEKMLQGIAKATVHIIDGLPGESPEMMLQTAEILGRMRPDGVKFYLGNYDDYYEKITRLQEPDGDAPQVTKTAMDKEKRRSREEEKRLREKKAALKQAEEAIAKAEEEAEAMEQQLSQPDTYQDAEKAAALAKAYQQKKDEIDELYRQWEALEGE